MTEVFKLKPFQQEAVSVISSQLGKKEKILISMPQGSGRMITLVTALHEYYKSDSGRTLLIVDSQVLKQHLKSVVEQVFGSKDIVSDSLVSLTKGKLIFIQTMNWLLKHKEQVAPDAFAVIVYVDYDHLAIQRGERNIRMLWDYFKPLTSMGMGYDTRPVRSFFGEITFRYTLQDAISAGDLRSWEVEPIEIPVEKSDYYQLRSGKNILEYQGAVQRISEYLTGHLADKKTVVLVTSQQNALDLSEAVNAQTESKAFSFPLIATVDAASRQKVIHRFREGSEIKMLIGVNLLLWETDLIDIDCIVLLRRFKNVNAFLNAISVFLKKGEKTNPIQIKDFVGMDFSSGLADKDISVSQDPGNAEEYAKAQRLSRTHIDYADRNRLTAVLGVKEIAGELADILLEMPCEQGRMIGIFGKWGRGKTFLMNKTWELIQGKNKNVIRIDFQAWKYQDTPAIWAYLYEKFASAYYCSAKSGWDRLLYQLRLNYKRLGYRSILWFTVTFVSSFLLGFLIPFGTKINWIYQIVTSLGISTVFSILLILFRYRNSARELFRKYYTQVSFHHLLGIQAEIQKELKTLIEVWTRKNADFKIILFVDDIDRCSEEKIVRIIDSLRVMLDDPQLSERIVIVAAIDERILKMAIQYKYAALVDGGQEKEKNRELVSEYMDKLFLIGLKLGNLTSEEVDEFFRAFTEQDREEGELPLLEQLLSSVSEKEEEDPEKENHPSGKGEKKASGPEPDTEEEMDPEREAWQEVEEEATLNGQESPQIPDRKLTREEINVLRKTLQAFPHKTPRQIRVFYYRYILAKHLLIKIAPDVVWTKSSHIESFVKILLILSDAADSAEMIAQEKMALSRETAGLYKIALLDGIEIPKKDYKILLKVLDLVIGY